MSSSVTSTSASSTASASSRGSSESAGAACAAAFFAVDLRGEAFVAPGFFAADFLAADFFAFGASAGTPSSAAGASSSGAFFAAVFFAAGFLAAGFFAAALFGVAAFSASPSAPEAAFFVERRFGLAYSVTWASCSTSSAFAFLDDPLAVLDAATRIPFAEDGNSADPIDDGAINDHYNPTFPDFSQNYCPRAPLRAKWSPFSLFALH